MKWSEIAFVVEKTATGYSAYAEDFEKIPVGTTGDHISDLKVNIVDALNTFNEANNLPEVSFDNITVKSDLFHVV